MTQDEIVARIDAIRLEAAPSCCPTCGSTVDSTVVKRCTGCGEIKPLVAFNVRRSRPNGVRVRSRCRDCDAAYFRHVRAEQFLRVLGRTA